VPVAVNHPVLGEERRERAAGIGVGRHHPLAVVRVQYIEPELVLVHPCGVRITEETLDLRADVEGDRGARVVGLHQIHVDDDPGDVFDQPPELLRGVFERTRFRGVIGV
jgi:hypothetical protein